MYEAYLGIINKKAVMRANAIELLENLLKPDLKRYVILLLDRSSPERFLRRAKNLYNFEYDGYLDVFREILTGQSLWLKACLIHLLGAGKITELIDDISRFKSDDFMNAVQAGNSAFHVVKRPAVGLFIGQKFLAGSALTAFDD